MTDLEILEAALLNISSMLERIHTYVQAVLKGERKGDPAVGRYLMDHLGTTTAELEKGAFVGNLQVISLLLANGPLTDVQLHRTHLWFHTLPTWSGHKRRYHRDWRSLAHSAQNVLLETYPFAKLYRTGLQLLNILECCKSCLAAKISPRGHVFAGPSIVSSKASSAVLF
jgi:hypothetical protein